MWSDNETRDDYLNFEDTVESVTDILRRKDLHPLSLGLFGGWGSGKSSLLQMVAEEVKNDDDVLIIHFDAWRFQGYDDARAALLETIGHKLLDEVAANQSLHKKALSLLGRINKLRALGLLAEGAALAAGLPAFGILNRGLEGFRDALSGKGDAEDLAAMKSAVGDAEEKAKGLIKPAEVTTPPQEIEQFRTELNNLLNEIDKSLLVFIDNLDRCLPRNAIHTLEAVRLFLFMDRTAFVIAADEEMIRVAVREHYNAGSARLTTDYLDKFVQYPIRVPSVGVNELKSLLIMLLLSRDDGLDDETMKALRRFFIEQLQQSWKEPFPSPDKILTFLSDHALTPDQLVQIRAAHQVARSTAPILASSPAIQGNPRIVKRLLNTVSQRRSIAEKRGINLSELIILKLVIFERCTSASATNELFRLVMSSSSGTVKVLEDWEAKGALPSDRPKSWQAHDEFISTWCTLEPKLGEKDLRAAVYLARDIKPVSASNQTLSMEATEALKTLTEANSRTRQSTKEAVALIPGPERLPVMNELIDQLDAVEDWGRAFKKPWVGAVSLAMADSQAAEALKALITRKFPNGPPKWTRVVLDGLEEVEF
ncbi:MAG: P-loop NTPase fold protein [Henriciella sp.]